MKKLLLGTCIFTGLAFSYAQQPISKGDLAGQNNPIITSVPFLIISPDSRASAMGDAGAATSPDVYSQHWNNAKYAFIEKNGGVGISYIPWLRNLNITDINILYANGYLKLDDRQAISGSLRYFSLGDLQLMNNEGAPQGTINPNEWAIDAGYALKLTEKLSGGVTFRFIYSDLTQGAVEYSSVGLAGAADVGFYYQTPLNLEDKDGEFAWGLQLSNIGNQLSYSEDQDPEFLPMNFRLGTRYTLDLDAYNSLSATLDLNKFLVPTPPEYDESTGEIIAGKDDNISVPLSMIQSFYDAPGGFEEELNEIMYAFGAEYMYRDQFAVRLGYFHENENKGNRKYFTIGFGFKLNVLGIDFSYLAPTVGNSPLANTVRFSLIWNFGTY